MSWTLKTSREWLRGTEGRRGGAVKRGGLTCAKPTKSQRMEEQQVAENPGLLVERLHQKREKVSDWKGRVELDIVQRRLQTYVLSNEGLLCFL